MIYPKFPIIFISVKIDFGGCVLYKILMFPYFQYEENEPNDFQVPWHVPCGGVCYGDGNLAFIANDWHTALLPVYLKAYYRDHGLMKYTRSVLVIHNIAYQVRHFVLYTMILI